MEKEFGERALNGDKTLLPGLKAQIADLERQLEQKQAAEKTKDEPKEDAGSEHETDSDVSLLMICYSFTHL